MTKDDEQFQAAIIDQINAELGAQNLAMTELAKRLSRPYDSTRNYLKKERAMPLAVFLEIATVLGVSPDVIITRARERL